MSEQELFLWTIIWSIALVFFCHLDVVHLTCRASDQSVTAKEDLQPVIDTFFQVASEGNWKVPYLFQSQWDLSIF